MLADKSVPTNEAVIGAVNRACGAEAGVATIEESSTVVFSGPDPIMIMKTDLSYSGTSRKTRLSIRSVEPGTSPLNRQLGPEKVQEVAAYVLTLKNTNVPGGKQPQGDIVVP